MLGGITSARGMFVVSLYTGCQLPLGVACIALHDTCTSFQCGIDNRNGCVCVTQSDHMRIAVAHASSMSLTHVVRECIPGNLPVGELLACASPASFTFHPHITLHMGHAFKDKAMSMDLG